MIFSERTELWEKRGFQKNIQSSRVRWFMMITLRSDFLSRSPVTLHFTPNKISDKGTTQRVSLEIRNQPTLVNKSVIKQEAALSKLIGPYRKGVLKAKAAFSTFNLNPIVVSSHFMYMNIMCMLSVYTSRSLMLNIFQSTTQHLFYFVTPTFNFNVKYSLSL